MMLTKQRTPCVWAVEEDLSTLFASPSFARLIGINRLVLAGLPWFVVLPGTSRSTLDWLVHTTQPSPTAILEIRHLEGEHVRVLVCRVHGGPGQGRAVLTVVPLDQCRTAAVIDATVSRVECEHP